MPQCRICSNQEGNALYTVNEMMFGTGLSYDYFVCAVCQCLQIAKIPVSLHELYPQDYYSYQPIDEKPYRGLKGLLGRMRTHATLAINKTLAERIVTAVLGQIDHHEVFRTLALRPETRFLDVGAGNGKFLLPLYMAGYRNCMGVDPFIEADLTYPAGLNIKKAGVLDLQEQFDVIFYNHSFEHIFEQRQELLQVHRLLAPDGKCVIAVPVFPSFAWDRYGVNWYQLDAPRHFFIHSVDSMGRLAQSAGFTIEKVHYNSTYAQFLISDLYEKGLFMRDRNPSKEGFLTRKYKKLKYARLAKQQNAAGRGDQAVFLLAKA